jgi:hypothetical protein
MISLCVIERRHAAPTVTALPFKPDRRRTDVTRL